MPASDELPGDFPGDLDALHWDERGDAVTATFEAELDEAGRAAWGADAAHTGVRYHVRFTGVADLRAAGWDHRLPLRLTVVADGGRVGVEVSGVGTDVRFTSAPPEHVGHRTFTAAAP
ncbi:hypothetical protein KCV87_33010 [Actinosynnema pretiosum subsp. pretiosum]|uniref:Uncharacterized protein n=2 Tax=Actinosynnema TaxID=40566 RepID=C6WLJ1_ACTMD|nr:hypothetical protein [Actinosynnema mirum]ACU38384.1 hypothetical protein Amir_4542 [Actinosynnema mirum DSM 43827]AXX31908.1 hypothetical protein APASM_4543 [Actinosynnema pretiosum subsp. pretiosum]QUF04106.1 hypothetical protein KCV87_33010 [Actinosynnema pretiosum subsp. pretiosum]